MPTAGMDEIPSGLDGGDDCPDEIRPSTILRTYGVNKDANAQRFFLFF